MRGAIISIGFGIGLLGCAPDLGVNAAQRCANSLECGPDALCYRGFCVPEEDVIRDAGSQTVLIDDDAASPPIGANRDAGVTPTNAPTIDGATDAATAAAVDASQSAVPATPPPGPSAADAGATSAPSTASTPSASTPAASTPSTSTPSATTPSTSTPTTSPTPTTAPTPNTPAQPAKPGADAGSAKPDAALPASSQDAGVPEVDLPGHCTVADCCKEARESSGPQAARDSRPGPGGAAGGDDEDDKTGPKEKKSKACGCADPALIGGILCNWLDPLGVLP